MDYLQTVMLNGVKQLSQGDPSLALRMTGRGTEDDRESAEEDK